MQTLTAHNWVSAETEKVSKKGSTRTMSIDPELLKLSAGGDRKAQQTLYKKSYGLLMSVCSRYANDRDEAMGLLNQGFLKILMHADKRKENVPVEAWMRRVMINTIIDAYRVQKNYKANTQLVDYSDQASVQVHDTGAQSEISGKLDAEALYAMLTRLPEMTGKVFNLFAIDGYSHKEIADMLRISEGTSKWHVNNARTLLKNMLNTHER